MVQKRSKLIAQSGTLQTSVVPFRAGGVDGPVHRTWAMARNQSAAVHFTPPSDKCVGIIECPYCDGENSISCGGKEQVADKEIACRHCQSLFLISESHRGIQFLPVQRPEVA
jgi:hypothetical protein